MKCIEKIDEEIAQAQATIARLTSAKKERLRREENQRKLILGAAILEAAKHDPEAVDFLQRLIAGISNPKDKAAFKDWKLFVPIKAAEASALER